MREAAAGEQVGQPRRRGSRWRSPPGRRTRCGFCSECAPMKAANSVPLRCTSGMKPFCASSASRRSLSAISVDAAQVHVAVGGREVEHRQVLDDRRRCRCRGCARTSHRARRRARCWRPSHRRGWSRDSAGVRAFGVLLEVEAIGRRRCARRTAGGRGSAAGRGRDSGRPRSRAGCARRRIPGVWKMRLRSRGLASSAQALHLHHRGRGGGDEGHVRGGGDHARCRRATARPRAGGRRRSRRSARHRARRRTGRTPPRRCA